MKETEDAGALPSQHLPADLREELLRARAGLAEAGVAFEAITFTTRAGSSAHGIACIGLQAVRRRLDRDISALQEGQEGKEPESESLVSAHGGREAKGPR